MCEYYTHGADEEYEVNDLCRRAFAHVYANLHTNFTNLAHRNIYMLHYTLNQPRPTTYVAI